MSDDRANEIMDSKRCHNCTLAFYCSEKCRKKDWPRHRGICLHIKNLTKDILLEEESSENNNADDEKNAANGQRKNWKSQTNSKSVGFEEGGDNAAGHQRFVPSENFKMSRDKRKQIERFNCYRNRDIRGREIRDTNQYQYVYYDNFNDGRSSRRCLDRGSSNNRYHSGLFDPNANHEVSDRGDFRDHSRYYKASNLVITYFEFEWLVVLIFIFPGEEGLLVVTINHTIHIIINIIQGMF